MQELGLQSVRTDAKKFYIKLQHRKNEICCSGILLRIGPIRYGTAISPILKSTIPVWKGAAPAEPQSQRCRTASGVFRGQERLHCLTLEQAMRGGKGRAKRLERSCFLKETGRVDSPTYQRPLRKRQI